MSEFYTLGLPRSRSLWLSFLLRTENADCIHEGLSRFQTNRLPQSSKRYIGSCDTNPLNFTPRSRLVIIERDVGDVIDSMIANFDNPFGEKPFLPFLEGLFGLYAKALTVWSGKRYHYRDLDDIDCLTEISEYLKPSEPVDRKYLEYMVGTVIRVRDRNILPGLKMDCEHLNLTMDEYYNKTVR